MTLVWKVYTIEKEKFKLIGEVETDVYANKAAEAAAVAKFDLEGKSVCVQLKSWHGQLMDSEKQG